MRSDLEPGRSVTVLQDTLFTQAEETALRPDVNSLSHVLTLDGSVVKCRKTAGAKFSLLSFFLLL